jgi:hypothetical protein
VSETVYQLEAPPSAAPASPEVTEGVRVGSALEHVTAHAAQGIGRLLQQFQEKQRIEDFLSALLDQVQEIEDAAWDLYIARTLGNAEGALLDQLGAKVGEERRGRTDGQYRRFIGVRILSNRSDGQIEQLYSILRQIFGGTFIGWIDELEPAAMRLDLLTPLTVDTPASEIDLVLGRSKGGGVRLDAVYLADDLADSLIVDSTVTTRTSAGQAIGSSVSSTGGVIASVHKV